ncbi:fungal-specific transcription factor domain-containing protein [Roridomyces roridus]|uniref:Fungal-specific transcription factor domain-containing protein n=1 Tax=Roridomyces roridus TaxID=1738132 RepID=A0AAD7FDA5_9AGAR|nr:fungal-specific transcription factor domain-containing protein [Roridomyces roridus]
MSQFTFVEPQAKKRRLKGACDICRKQKVRCDSAEMPGNICSNCIAFKSECTHHGTNRPNVGSTTRPLSATSFLNSRQPQEHIDCILAGSQEYMSGDHSTVYQVLVSVAQYARRLEETLHTSTPAASSAASERIEPDNADHQGYIIGFNLPESIMPITRDLSSNRFFGELSSMHFIKSVMDIKYEAMGQQNAGPLARRPEFWHVRPWEIRPPSISRQYTFPEPDLMEILIDHFFAQINILIYTFHAPTFRAAIAQGLHFRDRKFGAVVLVVCALGSKFSDEPRVFLEQAHSEHSAGWEWFRQVQPIPDSFAKSPTLYDLQLVCLSIMYSVAGSTPEETWTLAGLGLHMAFDVGAHRRIRSHEGDTVESEEYKRAFWMLLASDTAMSSLLGRPRAVSINRVDADLPMALEGEDPTLVIYGQLLIKLMEIWGRVQDEIYPIKGKEQNYQEIVADLDSALNEWVDSIPEQLRWDPYMKDIAKLNQSACIYATFYVQLLLHRPFIPSPANPASLSSISFPSLAICANAARSCGHVLDAQVRRNVHPLYNPQTISVLFDSAVVLLYNVFYRRPSADQSVQKLLNVLRVYERRWQAAGRNADIIAGMLDVQGADWMTSASLKRTRSFDSEELPPQVQPAEVAQDLAQLHVSADQDLELERLLFMPLHTEDLGRLPIYEPFDFDSIFSSAGFDDLGFSETETATGEETSSGTSWLSYATEG